MMKGGRHDCLNEGTGRSLGGKAWESGPEEFESWL